MEFLVFAAALIAIAVGAFVVVQGLSWVRSRTPVRETRFLERSLQEQQAENRQLRDALEEIYATRYSGNETKAHEDCVTVANRALQKARPER